jgi:hypothetical protein
VTLYQYPAIAAGATITSSLLTGLQMQFIKKGNTTSRTSTTSVTDDPDLVFPVVANAIYFVEWGIYYDGLTAGSINTQWDVPSGASGLKAVFGPGSSASDGSADNISMRCGVHGYTTSIKYSCARNSTNQQFAMENSVITIGSTAGNVALAWAQATSNGTATEVQSGSWGRCLRLA